MICVAHTLHVFSGIFFFFKQEIPIKTFLEIFYRIREKITNPTDEIIRQDIKTGKLPLIEIARVIIGNHNYFVT